MDPLTLFGAASSFGAGSLSPKSAADAAGGWFSSGPSGSVFGDFNVNFGGGGITAGGLPGAAGIPQWAWIAGIGAALWLILKKR